jgi:hypothetical protein
VDDAAEARAHLRGLKALVRVLARRLGDRATTARIHRILRRLAALDHRLEEEAGGQ